jgi:putative endopeptidase
MMLAINFGGIGAVIAHEITHGYDDQGRKFDHEGNICDWWQEEDTKLFASKTTLMGTQTETWTFVEEGAEGAESTAHKMNGDLTMGENLADLGGMSLAYQALEKRMGKKPSQEQQQAFFKSWANVWKCKQTSAYTVQQLNTDPHAPASFRGNLVRSYPSVVLSSLFSPVGFCA